MAEEHNTHDNLWRVRELVFLLWKSAKGRHPRCSSTSLDLQLRIHQFWKSDGRYHQLFEAALLCG